MAEAVDTKPTILVVDDSRLMRVAARKILKNDFDILEAGDGEDAWDKLQANTAITLVMSDLSMPNLDGLGLLKRIRESERKEIASLPVIIVTGAEDDDGSKNLALSAGASDFITKPFESVQLLARAKAQAKQKQTQQALASSEASKRVLEQSSRIDAVTGLVNRQAFDNHIEEALSYAARHRTELSLLVVRVEKYKVLFLRRGKQTAEEILRRITQVLSRDRRREDVVGRTGLDTFSVLLPSANLIGARRVAEQLHAAIQELSFEFDGEALDVNVSMALVCPDQPGETDVNELHEDADHLLKIALQNGGNHIHYVKPTEQMETLAEPAPEPSETLQTMAEAPAVASVAEVEVALQAIAHGREINADGEALARAVVPLLQLWNRQCDGSHGELVATLEAALGVGAPTAHADPANNASSTR